MKDQGELVHLFVSVFMFHFAAYMVIPATTDITMEALCPGRNECSLAIYLSGFQQAVHNPLIKFSYIFFYYLKVENCPLCCVVLQHFNVLIITKILLSLQKHQRDTNIRYQSMHFPLSFSY